MNFYKGHTQSTAGSEMILYDTTMVDIWFYILVQTQRTVQHQGCEERTLVNCVCAQLLSPAWFFVTHGL